MESLGVTSCPGSVQLGCQSHCTEWLHLLQRGEYSLFLMCICDQFPNLMDIPDILIISIDLLYKLDIPNIYGTYMVFIVIITVNPDT